MENVNIGHIISWVLVALGIGGFLIWKVSDDSRAKKRAASLRKTAKPCDVTVAKVELSRYGIAALIVDCVHESGEARQERFVPKTFTADIDAIAVDVGESGKLYAESFKDGSAAWLDIANLSAYGRMGYPVG